MVNAIQKFNVNVKKVGLVMIVHNVHAKIIVMKMDIVIMENVFAKMVILDQNVYSKHVQQLVTTMVYAKMDNVSVTQPMSDMIVQHDNVLIYVVIMESVIQIISVDALKNLREMIVH